MIPEVNPTKLIEETVIKWASENDWDCKVLMKDTVALPKVLMDSWEVDLFVLDKNPSLPLLAIMAYGLVRFPDAQIDRALDMCDRLNRAGLGKFTTMKETDDADLLIVYCLECPISDGAHAAVFNQTIETGITWLKRVYPALMLTRWGNMSVDRAFNIWRGKEEFPESLLEDREDEEDDSIMTDDDIRRLMGED